MNDSKKQGQRDPYSQDAFRNRPFTDEDAYFAEQERLNLERLQKERKRKDLSTRCCLSCPDQPLEQVLIDDVEIDRCPKCGGIWLDPGELEILTNRNKQTKSGLSKFFYGLAGRYDD